MAAELFGWLLRSALALAVVVCVVMALRPLWRRWLGAGAVLWLYLLVPAALVATSLPGPTLVRDAPRAAIALRPVPPAMPAPRSTSMPATSAASPDEPTASAAQGFLRPEVPLPTAPFAQANVLTVGLLAWAAGALALAGLLLQQQRRFRRRLGHLRRRGAGLWQASADDIGPVVIGLLRPRIIVPADFYRRYDAQQRKLVLAHERVHLRRGDLPVNALACVLRCLFWFNPLVHLAAAKLRLDQELACDAVVIARNPRAGRAYASALLNTQLADLGLPVGCAWQSSHPLTLRISMLKKPLPGPARLMLGAGLAVLASSAAATVLWHQQPATIVTLPAIAIAAAPATLPPLPAIGRVRVPTPDPVVLPALAAAPASSILAATPPPQAPVSAVLQVSAVAPAPAPAPLAAVATVAPAAPAAASDADARIPQSDAVARPSSAAAARAPPGLPVPQSFVESPDRASPPPPTPRGELSAPEPQVILVHGADPAAQAADYTPPRVRIAKPAKLPPGARIPPPQKAQVASGVVMRGERVFRPAARAAYVRRDVVVADGVVLRVSLDAGGNPVDAQVHESRLGPIFERNALAAVKRWRFEPARRAGQAEASTVLVPVWFESNEAKFDEMKANQLSHPLPSSSPGRR